MQDTVTGAEMEELYDEDAIMRLRNRPETRSNDTSLLARHVYYTL